MTPELHRPMIVGSIGPGGATYVVEASQQECDALAKRMQIPAIRSLVCNFRLRHDRGQSLILQGHLIATVVQTCVLSLEDFEVALDVDFTVRAVPAGEESDDTDPESVDDIGYSDGVLDLGEAAAEELALALDPYPRAPGAVLPEVDTGAEPNPFSGLQRLRRPH